jgi:HEAT repeat protein
MKTKIASFLALTLVGLNIWGQISTQTQNTPINDWIKNPATSTYSFKYEKKMKENFYKQNQKKYASNVDVNQVIKDLKSSNEEQRLSAVRILGLLPKNSQTSKLENLLVNDPSFSVRLECAKSLKLLKSTKSIPVLIKELKTQNTQLKIEITLTLASLGEKKESFKALQELGRKGEWKIILDTHLGYLDLATNEAIAKLKSDLVDSNDYVSVDAAIVLAELGYFKESFPCLKLKLTNPDKFIRMSALRGLAYIGNSHSIDLIRSMLNDSEPIVKDRSLSILKNCNLN